jgi:hypothetical protein
MTESLALKDRLKRLAADYQVWRAEADALRSRASRGGDQEGDILLAVEETSSRLYRGIETFEALNADIDRVSHSTSGQLAEVGDALRMLLLEVTELGIQLYGAPSLAIMSENT